ncbi:MAG: purine-nucleoside phosphorylase [Pyrinomonadaceae bacterium]|nr:purine-nucleoside phosphorylase [Pyrinomonadaceae bacterium]
MLSEEQSLSPLYERVEHAARTIRAHFDEDVRTGVVLGSGLGAFADDLEDSVALPYEEIPGFARPTVEGHAGRLVLGRISGSPVAVLQGRFHFYEGYSRDEVTFPMRVFGLMGIKAVVLTNAAGGINIGFDQGSLMIISDHLNLMCTNPLSGPNDARFGVRFPDMSEVYSREFQEIAVEEAKALGLELRRGVYAAMSGPSYETPAEVRMLRTLGADAVGMSTVPEAIVARQLGIRVLGLSCITNMAAGVVDQPINHEEVMETGAQVRDTFRNLLRRIIPRLSTV